MKPFVVLAATLLGPPPMTARAQNQPSHPRLFFDGSRLEQLRQARRTGVHRLMWRNMMASADWCLQRPLRKHWIAPVSPDPIYLNLYDRFYAMMHDMAVMEHLAFAYAYSRDARYREPARQWALAGCRVWSKEAEGVVDGGKAYAVTRLLKGLAVSYDLLYDTLSEAERRELHDTITRIGQSYYDGYFATESIAGPGFHTHHAIVEWASFGIAALAVLGEYPPAGQWLKATTTKFEQHLLPLGLAADGAQVEGTTFWASTMQYRLMFIEALRNVTGQDLFKGHEAQMTGDLAFASVAAPKRGRLDEDHQTVILEPSYGQLSYYSPVLVALAREYRSPLAQHLALWDETLGELQQTRYVTPNGEWLLFDWGGYAYAWYDPTVAPNVPDDAPLSFAFASVGEAYVRSSYQPGGIVAGARKGSLVIHAGGRPVCVETTSPAIASQTLTDTWREAIVSGPGDDGTPDALWLRLRRPDRLTVRRKSAHDLAFYCFAPVTRQGNVLAWEDGTTLTVTSGRIAAFDPAGFHDEKIVGMGRLKCPDPHPMSYPLVTLQPDGGAVEFEVRCAR